MIEYLILLTVLIYFAIASIEDIKKREVYDYINFSLVFFILICAVFHSFIIESTEPIKHAGFGLLIGFALGVILFYFGIWGGGDAKFILGFGAASYYLIEFTQSYQTGIGLMYEKGMYLLSNYFPVFLDLVLKYIIIIDVVFLVFVLVQFFLSKRLNEKKDLILLTSILLMLFAGLYFDYNPFVLTGLGFVAFLLIFISRDGIFDSVYFKRKKHLENLKAGDKLDDDLIVLDKKIVDYENGKLGLSKYEVHKIKDNITDSNKLMDVYVRKSLPYGMLIGLNYVMYMIKIISLERNNVEILLFMLKFLFFSFIAGGILAIVILLYHYFKNYSKVKIRITRQDIVISLIVIAAFMFNPYLLAYYGYEVLSFLTISVLLLCFILKIAKSVEELVFIKKKKIDEITLGDWIVQDIIIKHKAIYHKEDFRTGVDKTQLEQIKKLSQKHPKLRELLVKDGIAFLPALFLGFILMFII